MAPESTLQKVIVRTRDGDVRRGFGDPRRMETTFRLINAEGKEERFELQNLKAVFVVREFEGDPQYKSVQWLGKQKGSAAVWARLRFFDGEEMEGRIQNNLGLIYSAGFFLWPSDENSNNQCAYILKSALREFTILSAD